MVIIKKIEENDIDSLMELGVVHEEFNVANKDDWWSSEELLNWIKSENDFCIGAYLNMKLVGYSLSHIKLELSKVFLENIFVIESFRYQGIGERLLESTLDHYNKKFHNYPNLRFVALTKEDNNEFIGLALKLDFTLGEKLIWVQK